MKDLYLAFEIARRLNRLTSSDTEVRRLVSTLIETRVNVAPSLESHPTIQVLRMNDGVEDFFQVGFLGLLNGILGVYPEGVEKAQWGYLMLDKEGFTVTPNRIQVDSLLSDPKQGIMFEVEGVVSRVDGHETLTLLGESGKSLRVWQADLPDHVVLPKLGEKGKIYGHVKLRETTPWLIAEDPYPR